MFIALLPLDQRYHGYLKRSYINTVLYVYYKVFIPFTLIAFIFTMFSDISSKPTDRSETDIGFVVTICICLHLLCVHDIFVGKMNKFQLEKIDTFEEVDVDNTLSETNCQHNSIENEMEKQDVDVDEKSMKT